MALNTRKNPHLLGSSVDEFFRHGDLQFTMDKAAGQETQHNKAIANAHVDALTKAGAYRLLLPRHEWPRKDQAKWSGQTHKVRRVVNPRFVVNTKRALHEIRFALPVPAATEN